MNYRAFSIVVCRLIAVFWFFGAIKQLPGMVAYIFGINQGNTILQIYPLIEISSNLVFSFLLWFGANWLSARVLGNGISESETKEQLLDLNIIQSIVFSGIGLYILAISFPRLLGVFYREHYLKGLVAVSGKQSLASDYNESLIALSVQIVFGFFLLFGAKGFTGVVIFLRNLGTKSH